MSMSRSRSLGKGTSSTSRGKSHKNSAGKVAGYPTRVMGNVSRKTGFCTTCYMRSDVMRRILIRIILQMNGKSDREQICINGHADHGVGAQRVQRINFLLAANAAGHDELALGEFTQARGCGYGKTLHQSFAIHVRVEKCGDVRFELRNRFVGSECHLRLPSFDGDAAIFGVDAGNYAVRANGRGKRGGKLCVDRTLRGEERRANDDALCARIEHLLRALDRVDAAAGLNWQPLGNPRYQFRVIALAHGRVEIDQLD